MTMMGTVRPQLHMLARDHDSEYMMIHSADAQKAARKQFAGPAAD